MYGVLCIVCGKTATSKAQKVPLTVLLVGLGCLSRAGWAKTEALGVVRNEKNAGSSIETKTRQKYIKDYPCVGLKALQERLFVTTK
ncbi:hypothetical protein SDC9_116413 [bioreactor metagenome]|uniref:Uncharacterized protein n=1 Tax=bioreactor metagenome TaxID=1076179 RepID=A0A645BWI7_9ZZZZ